MGIPKGWLKTELAWYARWRLRTSWHYPDKADDKKSDESDINESTPLQNGEKAKKKENGRGENESNDQMIPATGALFPEQPCLTKRGEKGRDFLQLKVIRNFLSNFQNIGSNVTRTNVSLESWYLLQFNKKKI